MIYEPPYERWTDGEYGFKLLAVAILPIGVRMRFSELDF